MLRPTQTLIAPPAVEPVTVEQVKQWMKLGDEVEDDLIADLIRASRESAELYTGRAFITQTLKLTVSGIGRNTPWIPGHFDLPVDFFDTSLPKTIELPRQPVQSIESVTTFDNANIGTVFPAGYYRLVGNRLTLNDGRYWPSSLRTCSPLEIVYKAGYGDTSSDVPAMIRTAIKRNAQDLYGAAFGGSVKVLKAGDGTIEYFEGGSVSSSVASLLAPYRILRVG